MNGLSRRGFIGAAVSAALTPFVRPAPRPRIDLMQFCGRPGQLLRYDVALPYTLGGHTFATDTAVCVRVASDPLDEFRSEGRPPPFHSLPWRFDDLRGWKSLPTPQPMLAADSPCPACDGTGNVGGVESSECVKCDGWGCSGCGDSGLVRPAGVETCAMCGGKAVGVFPSVVEVGGQYYQARLYTKVARLGGEYVTGPRPVHTGPGDEIMLFRFHGGEGMLMPLDAKTARARLSVCGQEDAR